MARSDLFVRESRAPVTWCSKQHMYALRTSFLDREGVKILIQPFRVYFCVLHIGNILIL